MHLVVFGLSLSSSWGNGHATTYRGLLGGWRRLGHSAEFFERDLEWYASHRDLPNPPQARLHLYSGWTQIRAAALDRTQCADAVLVGSYFPDAIPLLDALLARDHPPLAFYDIDTPITLEQLHAGRCAYLRPNQIPALDLYLSFTGGPVLDELRIRWGAQRVRPLYCACDERAYTPPPRRRAPTALSFLGTYAPDRQAKLEQLLLQPARRLPRLHFRLAGSMYPDRSRWPPNLAYDFHLPPAQHPAFYGESRFTLNLTRQAMVEAGYSPSIRLFEAAACATPILSDPWPGLDGFFRPGHEILLVHGTEEMVDILLHTPPDTAAEIGRAARARVLQRHTCQRRAAELESYFLELRQPDETERAPAADRGSPTQVAK